MLVRVMTVTDEANRIVTGLWQETLHLCEDKDPQPIKHFWEEDEPASIGILLDVSGSMRDKFEGAQDAVKALLRDSNPQDEFFLLTLALDCACLLSLAFSYLAEPVPEETFHGNQSRSYCEVTKSSG